MADLVGRVDNALNEARILVLLGQVLFAYSFEAAFEGRFAALPQSVTFAGLVALTLQLLSLAILLTPAPFHAIVEGGNDSEGFHKATTAIVTLALPIFAAGMALEIFVVVSCPFGPKAGLVMGLSLFACAAFFWMGLECLARRRRGRA